MVQQVSPVPGEEAEEQEIPVAATLALIPLAETAEGAGMTGDLEEEGEEQLGQGHICLMVEHPLTLVNSDQLCTHNSLHMKGGLGHRVKH